MADEYGRKSPSVGSGMAERARNELGKRRQMMDERLREIMMDGGTPEYLDSVHKDKDDKSKKKD